MHHAEGMQAAAAGARLVVPLSLAATVLGLFRFSYGVVLPAMRTELGWSYAKAGVVETASAVGYLAGALLSPVAMMRTTPAGTLRTCAAVTSVSLVGCAATTSLPVLAVLRGLGGGTAAALYVSGGLLAARLATTTGRAGRVLALYYAGVGPGIFITAILAAPVLDAPHRWRFGWLALGVLAGVCAIIASRAASRVSVTSGSLASSVMMRRGVGWALVAFALFGVGYVPYTTFAVAYWHDARAAPPTVTALWALLAGAATASGWIWRGTVTRPAGLVVLLGVVAAAVALPLASTGTPVLAVSVTLFGVAFLTVSAATTALIRRSRPHREWDRTLAVFTAAFAGGQLAGPVVAGHVADRVGLRGALAAAAAVLAAATAAAWLQFRRDRREDPPSVTPRAKPE